MITGTDFSFLYDLNTSKSRDLHYWQFDSFHSDAISEDDVYADFRFLKNDIRRLRTAFRLSNKIISGFYSDLCNDSVEMCILLKRLAYSNRYSDTISLFRRTFPRLSVDKVGNSWTWEHGVTIHDDSAPVHHVPKCMSCRKDIVVITRKAHCFHDCIYI